MRTPVLLLSVVAAILIPSWLLWPHGNGPAPVMRTAPPILPSPLPRVGGPDRRLFLDPVSAADAGSPADAPLLAGIAGRLPHDAVAMVRNEDGTTAIVAIDQIYRGWRLEALAADAALFVRGTQRLRVPLPAHDPVGESEREAAR